MPVKLYIGFTKSGKSTLAQKNISKFEKVVIFDKQSCFEGDIYEDPSLDTFKKIFRAHLNKNSYRIVIRPGRLSNKEALCDDTIKLASSLGRLMGKGAPGEKCVQLVIDEADSICNSGYQSPKLQFIINEGRHDNVDTHCIARNPNRLHTDIRTNVSETYTFRLANALEIPFMVSTFNREHCKRILTLKKYWFYMADETGFIGLFDDTAKLVKDFSAIEDEFYKKETPKKVRRKA